MPIDAEGPTLEPSGDAAGRPSLGHAPGESIGRYRLVARIGEGGFGVVWRAEQTEPVRREVALKVIKPGMDSASVLARFDAERQSLAVMEHECIARVLDGGATARGLPFFVMELVRGEPINAFCERHRLGLRDRLALFSRVCQAVQHAHIKGVVHRDLKPSNILVAYDGDGSPLPKVIDFGIAKALSGRMTEQTIFTERGQLIGTPEYMSPEQAEMGELDIDTRSDVYSLGVVLYELLAGGLPFESASLRRAGFAEIQRIIREETPPRPSTRVLASGVVSSGAAGEQHDAVRLATTLRRDLDWVVMRCLEKERSRRYESPAAIAEEITRFLAHQPVLAGPPGLGYRVRKFVERNRVRVVLGAVMLGVVALGAAGTVTGLVAALAANRDLAEQQAATQRELTRANEVKSVMSEMLESVRPEMAELADTSLLMNMLAGAERRLGSGEVTDPLIRAELHLVIGRAYMGLGRFERAAHHLPEAERIRTRELGADHPDSLITRTYHAQLLFAVEEVEEAARRYEGILEDRRRVLGEDHALTAATTHNLAGTYAELGRLEEAEALALRAIELVRALGPAHERDRLMYEAGLGITYADQGRFVESETLFRRLHGDLVRVVGAADPMTIDALHEIAMALVFQERHAEAITLLQEELELCHRVYGETHPFTVETASQMAMSMTSLERFDEAEAVLTDRVGIAFRALAPDHPLVTRLLESIDAVLVSWESTGGGEAVSAARRDWADLAARAAAGEPVGAMPEPVSERE